MGGFFAAMKPRTEKPFSGDIEEVRKALKAVHLSRRVPNVPEEVPGGIQ